MRNEALYRRIAAAFVWIAAFCLACGVFLSLTLLFNRLPPTDPIAVGRVTIERYSKLRDYLGAALFFLLVPPLTIWFRQLLARGAARQRTFAGIALFTVPYFFAPFFYLTTAKVAWILLLPVILSFAAPRLLDLFRTRLWLREMFRPELGPYHALLFVEALAWLFFRYLVTGRRIAHVPTLFLEIVFVAMFLAIFWAAALLIARLAQLNFGASTEEVFRRIVVAALPMVLLPVAALVIVPLPYPRAVMALTLLVITLAALALRRPFAPRAAWRLAAWLLIPALIYVFSYASTAQLSEWIDLFHRGESIGPASDYLRGKVPFRDVFALHGMLEDGLLDAWLMQIFGRSLEVAVARTVILGSFLGVAIWFLGIAVFRSIPLALLCVAMGSWTTAENNRTLFQVAAVALFWTALRQHSRIAAVLSGVFAGVALFFSLDIGLYSIAGGFAALLLLWIASLRVEWNGMPPARAAVFFALGVVLGCAPFAIYLAMHGALDDFAITSFVTIPRIIDAVWSLPFPDLVSTFRKNLNLHTLAEFVLWEKFHLILSPLTIAIAAVYYIQRWLRRRTDMLDHALLVLTVFATVAQRTAFGRVSFRHQYFAAFLIGPMLVLLGFIFFRMMRRIWVDGSAGTRAFVAALAVAGVPVIGVLFWIPDLVDARLQEMTRYTLRVSGAPRDAHAEEVHGRIQEVSAKIKSLTRPNEPIFDFSNQPAFYFFANRPNPTRFYQVPILSPWDLQAETIHALEGTKPPVVIRRSPEQFDQFDGVTNELRAQAVAAYLDDSYFFHEAVRGVELWVRNRDAAPRRVADYLGLIRLPAPGELVSTGVARLVFPAAGSVGGIGGAWWQSDLTLHNPFREPIRVTLRYMLGDRAVDRRVTIEPRQTMRWPDVVDNLFGMRGTVGTLWIEHRESRAPVAVMKTHDITREASGSIDKPLSKRDAAVGGSETAELAIVGIPPPSEGGRRVNAGVVNIGIVDAAFELSVATHDGRTVGEPIIFGVPEDRLWLMNDLEREVGVKIDETMTIRIRVISGTGVAFATIVESTGDSEFIAATPAEQR